MEDIYGSESTHGREEARDELSVWGPLKKFENMNI